MTGRTLAENVADAPELFAVIPGPGTRPLPMSGTVASAVQDVVRPLAEPIKRTGHITILRGNLAPGSAVAKITGAEGVRFDGTARCFDDLDAFYPALAAGKIRSGMVLVFRYQGPKGAPGMPEVWLRVARCSTSFLCTECRDRLGRCWVRPVVHRTVLW